MKSSFFTKKLLEWNKKSNSRQMPWKNEKDPYKIWLSEIILQQTRVEQGWDYYNKFINHYPTVQNLAKANENEVFKLWEGLGYYNRCRNLITTAKYISEELNGEFPETYNEIIALKGVGPYTAAAIASFAYGLPFAVVDGNVTRVLSRFYGINTPIDSTAGKKEFELLAQSLIDKKNPGIYNQAIMDFGATICKPKSPLCNSCNLSAHCVAFQQDRINLFPQKLKSIQVKERWFYYLVLSCRGKFYVQRRIKKDVWQNLYEFILIDDSAQKPPKQQVIIDKIKNIIKDNKNFQIDFSHPYKQKLTHQTINCYFIRIDIKRPIELSNFEKLDNSQLKNVAFPKVIVNYLNQKML